MTERRKETWPSTFQWGIDALAVHRLTRLVTKDVLTRWLRHQIIAGAYDRQAGSTTVDELDAVLRAASRRAMGLSTGEEWPEDVMMPELDDLPSADPLAPKLATLVTCRWCASVYVAVGVVAARRLAPRCWSLVANVLAFSSASTFLASLED